MKIFTIFIVFIVAYSSVNAQSDYLKSFASNSDGGISTSVSSGNKLFFSAYDTTHGRELWVTDGTSAGTHLVKNINPGIGDGLDFYFSYYAYDFNGILYFQANDRVNGYGLWRSDGTKEGTWLVSKMYIDGANHHLGEFASTDSVLFFLADGKTLWRSNGTNAGTYSLAYFSYARELTTFKNNLYFSAATGNGGEELWKTNGKTGYTALLKDINGVYGTSLPNHFHATTDALYFMATTSAGCELWKTTGSESSTQMVKDIKPGSGDGTIGFYWYGEMTSIGNIIYFTADDGINGYQMWKSDGTDAGTVKVSSLEDGVSQYCNYPIVNGKVFYYSDEDESKFWQYDPASKTTAITGYTSYFYYPRAFLGTYLFYTGQDSVYGAEIWQSTGTPSSTRKIQEISLIDNIFNKYLSGPDRIVGTVGSKLVFTTRVRPLTTEIPVYSYDTSLATTTAFAPSILTPVPITNSRMDLVWNRIENATQYEIRYRTTTGSWTTKTSALSYAQFTNLLAGTDYYFQVRALCDDVWTGWGKRLIYNNSTELHGYNPTIFADRAQDATTMRIYWAKTTEIEKLQLRYRVAGTTIWTTATNKNGLFILSNLLPSTFYEYEYRAYSSGYWGSWYRLYFQTPEELNVFASEKVNLENQLQLLVTPNPAVDEVYILSKVPSGATYIISNAAGNLLQTGKLTSNKISLPTSGKGLFTITVYKDDFKQSAKILKE